LKALHAQEYVDSVFVHLYGQRPPDQGGPLWAQNDQAICGDIHTSEAVERTRAEWQPGETAIQQLELPIPSDLPPGEYTVVAGIYERATVVNLPITTPPGKYSDRVVLAQLHVAAGPASD
jgi:hypothetical protein